MYSASVVDNETHFYNFDCHDIASLANVNKYLEVDFLLSRSLAISEFVYPWRNGFDPPKLRHTFEVSVRYLKIHFTASQCVLPGFARNLLTTPTVWEISRRVHTIAHIKFPIADEYEMTNISSFSFFVDGQDFLLNLKCLTNEVETDFEYFILNFSSIRSISLSCDS